MRVLCGTMAFHLLSHGSGMDGWSVYELSCVDLSETILHAPSISSFAVSVCADVGSSSL
jgi:hypothetical protein